MNCDRARDLMSAYVDGELAGDERHAMAAHVDGCAACAALAREYRAIGAAMAASGREPVPAALADKIARRLATAAGSETGHNVVPMSAPVSAAKNGWLSGIQRQAAVLVVACGLSALASWMMASSAYRADRVEQDAVAAHMRSLLADSPIQVASSDSHTVRPWFAGRVDVAPEAKDLTAEGFPLLGGRLDYVDGRRVATLVYKRRLHTISVFASPAGASVATGVREATHNGYSSVEWSRQGVTYRAVSDLSIDELRRLQSLL